MDEQIAMSRILEVTNLTDELDDDEANALIDWAAKNVGSLVTDSPDDDQAGEKVNNLMEVMRKINELTANRKSQTPEQMQAHLKTFGELVEKTFGVNPTDNATALGSASSVDAQPNALKSLSGIDFIKNMVASVDQALAAAPSTPGDAAGQAGIVGGKVSDAAPKPDSEDAKEDDSPTLSM